MAIMASYVAARMRRLFVRPPIETFEDWIVDRFGRRLYSTFFKTYTEKVWGVPCNRIGADWAAQRIKGLSLTTAVWNALRKPKVTIKTLVDEFMYPRLGAGQLYEKMARVVAEDGGDVLLDSKVVAIRRRDTLVTEVLVRREGEMNGRERVVAGDYYLCSAPLTEMLEMMDPPPPSDVLAASRSLRYRNHVGRQARRARACRFPTTGSTCMPPKCARRGSPTTAISRRRWRSDRDVSPLTVEYFCFPGDGLWELTDASSWRSPPRSSRGLASPLRRRVIGGFIVRSEKAYPVIEKGYEQHIACIRRWLSTLHQSAADRPLRNVQVQQPGPRDRDRAARRPHGAGAGEVRSVERQHRRRIPRVGRRVIEAPLPAMLRFRPFLFCLATALTVAAALWPVLGGEYAYDQFVVGSMSWHAENKSVDYQALAVVVVAFLALAFALGRLVDRIDDGSSDARAGVENVMGFALLPLALWLGTAITRNTAPGFPYAFALSAGAFVLYAAWLWSRSPKLDGKTISEIGGTVLCTFLLAFFAGLACLLLLFHASGHGVPASPEIVGGAALAAVGINALVVGTVLASPGELAIAERSLRRWCVFLQLPLPLLGLVLLPAFITYWGVAEPYVWPWSLVMVLAVYAACAWYRLARRLRTDLTAGSLEGALEPLALAMIAVFLVSHHAMFELMSTPGYPTLFGDDFHLGEQILPWQQWREFNRLPYVDFAPVHGLMPLITGALNEVFFDGMLAHLDLAFAVLVAISCVLTVCLASRTCGALAGLALCFLLAPFDRLLFLAPALLLLSDAALLRRPVAWIAAWLAVTVFMIGYNAAVGSAFAGGTMPWVVVTLYRSYRGGKSARQGVVLVALVAVATLLLIPHLAEVFTGLLKFIAENGATNMVGHGVALARGFDLPGTPTDGVLASRILFDLLCLTWIAVALHALQRGFADWLAVRRGRVGARVAVLPLATGLSLLLLAAWSIGRIDVAFSSRTGAVSFLAVGTLLPVMILARGRYPASTGDARLRADRRAYRGHAWTGRAVLATATPGACRAPRRSPAGVGARERRGLRRHARWNALHAAGSVRRNRRVPQCPRQCPAAWTDLS